MPARFLIMLLCFSPGLLFAKQEYYEQDLELFEFLAMYEKNDAIFIDSEIDDKTESENLTNQHVNTSESDE